MFYAFNDINNKIIIIVLQTINRTILNRNFNKFYRSLGKNSGFLNPKSVFTVNLKFRTFTSPDFFITTRN